MKTSEIEFNVGDLVKVKSFLNINKDIYCK